MGDNVSVQPPSARSADRPPIRSSLDLDAAGYERLTRDVRPLLGIDLAQYRPQQVWRRVIGFAAQHGCASPEELVVKARTDPGLKAAFMNMLTINVSEFFRNPDVWERFASIVAAPLVKNQSTIRVWSAGCSSGYEPYVLGMLFREASPTVRAQILATDLDENIIAVARAARYPTGQMAGVSPARRARFFVPTSDGYEVKPEIRSMVRFARHDLLRDPMGSSFDVIACRNVVIYFTDEAKSKLYTGFARALRPGGTLLIGATESIAGARDFGLEPISPGLYSKSLNSASTS